MHRPTVYVCGYEENQSAEIRAGLSPVMLAALDGWVAAKVLWPHNTRSKALVDCCNRIVPLHTTEGHKSIAFSGYVSEWRNHCAPGQGCTVNPNHKRTAHLRYYERG